MTKENSTSVGVLKTTAENVKVLAECMSIDLGLPRVPTYVALDRAVRREIKRLAKKHDLEVELSEVDDG